MIIADLGDVLGSPVWTVLATIFAAAAIWVSVWLYRRQRTQKSLSYEIKATELVSVHSAADDAKDRIRIFFDNEQIEQVHLVEVRIGNNGNVPVESGDFEGPLTIELGENAAPLTVDVTDMTTPDLRAVAVHYKTGVALGPLLLNPGDGLTLKILARNLQNEVECHYRIVGITEMTDAASQRQGELSPILKAMTLAAIFGAAGAVGVLSSLGASSVLDSALDDDKSKNPSTERNTCIVLPREERSKEKSPVRPRGANAATQAIRELCLELRP